MVGGQPDPPRGEHPGVVDRAFGDRHPARRMLARKAASIPSKSRLSRRRHGVVRNGRRSSPARNQRRLSLGPRRIRRHPPIRASVRGSAGWPPTGAMFPRLTCVVGFRAHGLLFRALRHQAPACARPARSRYCPGGGFLLRPTGTGFPLPVPRPRERCAGLVRVAGPLVAAAKIARRPVAIDSIWKGRPTSGYERPVRSGT